jgi:hypothetical protein
MPALTRIVLLLCLLSAVLRCIPQQVGAAFDPLRAAEPDATIVRIEIRTALSVKHCSGVIVSAVLILTARHCINDAEAIRVQSSAWIPDVSVHAMHPERDLAIIRLPTPASTWRTVIVWDRQIAEPVWSLGYRLLAPAPSRWNGTIDTISGAIAYQESAHREPLPGMSGSPLLLGDQVIGVHVHRRGDATGYALIDDWVRDQIVAVPPPPAFAPLRYSLALPAVAAP